MYVCIYIYIYLHIYIYIYICVCVCVFVYACVCYLFISIVSGSAGHMEGEVKIEKNAYFSHAQFAALLLSLYPILPLPIVYGVWHTREVVVMVVQQYCTIVGNVGGARQYKDD